MTRVITCPVSSAVIVSCAPATPRAPAPTPSRTAWTASISRRRSASSTRGSASGGNLGDAGLDLEVDPAQDPLLDGLVKFRVEGGEHGLVGGDDEIVDLITTLTHCPPRLLGNDPGEGLDALISASLIALLRPPALLLLAGVVAGFE